MKTSNLIVGATIGCAFALTAVQASSATSYITDFAKTNNIYTNLNEQFPNTGPGVPGSAVGAPNATYLFTPQATGQGNPDNVNDANNGVSFQLASNATGQDFAEIGGGGFGLSSLTVPLGVTNADHLYLLMGAYDGTSFNITLNGTGGATQTFSNIGLPDFNGGGPVNSVGGGVADQTVFRVLDVGAGGTGNSTNGSYNYYDLTEVGLTLDASFAGQTLQNAYLTSNGYETLLLGATVTSVSSAAPEPEAWALMLVGFGLIGAAARRRVRIKALLAA